MSQKPQAYSVPQSRPDIRTEGVLRLGLLEKFDRTLAKPERPLNALVRWFVRAPVRLKEESERALRSMTPT